LLLVLEVELVVGTLGIAVPSKLAGTVIPSVLIPITHFAVARRRSEVRALLSHRKRKAKRKVAPGFNGSGTLAEEVVVAEKVEALFIFEDESLGASTRFHPLPSLDFSSFHKLFGQFSVSGATRLSGQFIKWCVGAFVYWRGGLNPVPQTPSLRLIPDFTAF
jgi:hypothetical protein